MNLRVYYIAAVSVVLTGTLGWASVTYQPPPFERYQVILDRMPFGLPPANFDPNFDAEGARSAALEQAEQQRLAQQINMSAVTITPGGKTAIGFTDLNIKPPVNYYLLVGESSNGWQVKEADFDAETATIEKDGVTITLKLGQGLVPSGGAEGVAGGANGGAAQPASGLTGRPIRTVSARQAPSLARSTTRNVPGLVSGAVTTGAAEGSQPSTVATVPRTGAAVATQSEGGSSHRARLLERETRKNEVAREKEKQQREQLERLAREVAQSEIARREAEAAEAAEAEAAYNEQQEVYVEDGGQ